MIGTYDFSFFFQDETSKSKKTLAPFFPASYHGRESPFLPHVVHNDEAHIPDHILGDKSPPFRSYDESRDIVVVGNNDSSASSTSTRMRCRAPSRLGTSRPAPFFPYSLGEGHHLCLL